METRNVRTYKCTDKTYTKAKKKAKKDNTTLASLIERWVENYNAGSSGSYKGASYNNQTGEIINGQ